MTTNGFLNVRVFTSAAQLPVENATVTVTQPTPNGSRLIASRITDESGLIEPIAIPAPERAQSLQAGNAAPYTSVDIIVDHPDFERVLVENAQIFAGVQTEQEVSLIPYEERPNAWNLTETFQVTAQPL